VVLGVLERTKERGMVLNAVAPQLRILQHPATGAFLSHCGWNSVIESMSGGVPILAAPLRAEQKMMARSYILTPNFSPALLFSSMHFFPQFEGYIHLFFFFFPISPKFWIDKLFRNKAKIGSLIDFDCGNSR